MTEKTWLRSPTPKAMLKHLQQAGAADRRVRLFMCACWRQRVHRISDPAGMMSDIEAVEADRHHGRSQQFFPTYRNVWYAANATSEVHAEWSGKRPPEPGVSAADQAAILRDIFGNLFRPVTFSPDWRTDTAVSLARQMYVSGEFSAMPILADALQDAGCDSEDVLSHCRDASGTHVRGCWVVDGVLGKE